MSKKVLSVLLAVMMVFGIVSVTSVAAEDNSRRIYLEIPVGVAIIGTDGEPTGEVIDWSPALSIYAYLWNGNGELDAWGARKIKMKPTGEGNLYYFDVPESTNGAEWDCVIFNTDSSIGQQTYDCIFNVDCFGDTAYVSPERLENPIDSSKTALVAAWKNTKTAGPHVAINSSGKVGGTTFLPGETVEDVINAALANFNDPASSMYDPTICTEEKLAEYKVILDELYKIQNDNPVVTDPASSSDASSSDASSSDASSSDASSSDVSSSDASSSDASSSDASSSDASSSGGSSTVSDSSSKSSSSSNASSGKTGGSSTASSGNSSDGKGTVKTADTSVAGILVSVLLAGFAVAYMARKRENA